MANSKAVIDIIAANTRTFNMLEFVLQQHGKGRFELGRGNRPELVVVDFDKADLAAAFKKYRARFPGIPAVLLLSQPEEYQLLSEEERIGAEYILLKPFAVKDFISKIDECLGGLAASQSGDNSVAQEGGAAAATGFATRAGNTSIREVSEARKQDAVKLERTQPLLGRPVRPAQRHRNWEALENDEIAYSFAPGPDIDLADEGAVGKVWLNIENKLLGCLSSVIPQQASASVPLCLSVRDGLKLYVSAHAKTVSVMGDNASLLELAGLDFGEGQISFVPGAIPEGSRLHQIELQAFLWKLALYTYRGYLPAGISVNQPVYLKYWPNLTRFEPTPNAMRIAALLNRQPVPLAFLVRILSLPQKQVFNFYAAAHAAGLAGPAVREVDRMLLPSYPDAPAYVATLRDVDSAEVSDRKIV